MKSKIRKQKNVSFFYVRILNILFNHSINITQFHLDNTLEYIKANSSHRLDDLDQLSFGFVVDNDDDRPLKKRKASSQNGRTRKSYKLENESEISSDESSESSSETNNELSDDSFQTGSDIESQSE